MPWVRVPPLRPYRDGLCSIPIFLYRKIRHMRRHSPFSQKVIYSPFHCRCHLFVTNRQRPKAVQAASPMPRFTFLHTKKNEPQTKSVLLLFRRRPTLPGSFPPSTISTAELNFRVRDGNGCDLCVIATEYSEYLVYSQN